MRFELNSLYNFSTFAPSILGATYRRCKVVAIVDYDTAMKYGNIELMQKQIYPLLPSGTPDRTNRYTYILFKDESGSTFVLAYSWIIEDSITKVTSVNLSIQIYDITESDTSRIRDVLNSMGYKFKIEVLDV